MLFVYLKNGMSSANFRYNDMNWEIYNSSDANHVSCDAFYIPVKKGHSFSLRMVSVYDNLLFAALYPYK